MKTYYATAQSTELCIARDLPRIAESFECYCAWKTGEGDIAFRRTETNHLIAIKMIANDIFVAETFETCYVIKVAERFPSGIYFAISSEVPSIGREFRGKVIYTNRSLTQIQLEPLKLERVSDVVKTHDLYKVTAGHYVYVVKVV